MQKEPIKGEDLMDIYKRIGIVCNSIPGGKVATYGQIALLCERPGNSRQVGYALKKGLAGEVPAHRIVNAKGILSGSVYFDTCDLQKLLLEEEGVSVTWTTEGWRVDLKQFKWENTLEDVLRFQKQFREDSDIYCATEPGSASIF